MTNIYQNNKINVVMPIAGLGSRFTMVGIDTPKPLIKIFEEEMAKWAAKSIPFAKSNEFIFILRKEHVDNYQLDKKIKELFPGCKTITINYVTKGAACTVLLAKEFINNDYPLIVTDCDHFFVNKRYNDIIKDPPKDLKGIIPVFKAEGEKWSFSKFDEKNIVSQVAEKKRISTYANIGAYYFQYGKDFVWAAEKMINNNEQVNNEFYVAPVYQQLINRGDKIMAVVSEEVWGLGTPEDVKFFEERNSNRFN